MDRLLADELILRILSYLDAPDLAHLQSVSPHLRTLAKDRHLWKRLFYFAFVRPTSSHADSSTLPTLRELRSLLLHQNLPSSKHVVGDGIRPIQRLPRRFYSSLTLPNQGAVSDQEAGRVLSSLYLADADIRDTSMDHLLDWEQLFRVSTNWQRGNFAASHLLTPSTREAGLIQHASGSSASTRPQHTIVRVSNNLIFAATPSDDAQDAARLPTISVYASEHSASTAGSFEPQSPKDLNARTPLACFSSPGLQKLLSRRQGQVHVTEIAVDASVSDASLVATSSHRKRKSSSAEHSSGQLVARIMVAYSTGHLSIFELQTAQGSLQASEVVFHCSMTSGTGDHVVMAALYAPVLVVCSSRFNLEVLRIQTTASGSTELRLVHRMSSYRCSWPAALRLKKLPYHDVSKRARRASALSPVGRTARDQDHEEEVAFRVTLAYSTPSYPSSWSVSLQELVIRLRLGSTSAAPVHVTSRHATAKHPFRPTPIDLRGRSMLDRHSSPQHSRLDTSNGVSSAAVQGDVQGDGVLHNRTTSLTYDDPFVVVGASDNLLEVYELLGATTHVRRDLEAATASVSRSATATPVSQRDALRLVHRRSLHGHTGSVHSVALEDGRCVSGSADGSVMVWSLGDRSNETDSIASVLRHARGANVTGYRGGAGARSSSSTILEEEEAEEAASQMTHVLTLRTPMEADQSDAILPNEKHTESARSACIRYQGPSLGHLVRSRVLDRQTSGVIRWVSTAFDKIVSIVTYPDPALSLSHASGIPSSAETLRERVQVWSFG